MLRYMLRRTGISAGLLLAVTTMVFFLIHMLPGDPALVILGGDDASPTEEAIQRVRERLGLDRPVLEQYVRWLGQVIRGDLGRSFVTDRPIVTDIGLRLPRTLQLIVPAIALAVVIGVPLGILAARARATVMDPLASAFTLLGFSTPVFVSGTILVLIFALKLGWLPSSGYVAPAVNLQASLVRSILPVATLCAAPMAVTMRMTRSCMLEQLSLDHIRTARAKGLTERVVVYRHALRNALIPVVTVLGLQTGAMFAGSVLVEHIYNWPGLNAFLLRAIWLRDYPAIQGVVLTVAAIFTGVNLLTDLSYAFLNPRIRYR